MTFYRATFLEMGRTAGCMFLVTRASFWVAQPSPQLKNWHPSQKIGEKRPKKAKIARSPPRQQKKWPDPSLNISYPRRHLNFFLKTNPNSKNYNSRL